MAWAFLNGIAIIFIYIPQVFLQDTIVTNIETVTYKGSTTTIDCPINAEFTVPSWRGPPALTVYTSGLSINPLLKHKISFAANSVSLIMTNTTLTDNGRYVCSKLVDGLIYVGNNYMSVRILPSEPTITASVQIDDKGIRATEWQPFRVTCTSQHGYPAPNVVLYKGGINGQVLANTSTGTQAEDNIYTVKLSHTFIPKRQDDGLQLLCRSYYPLPINAQDSQTKDNTLYLYLKPLQATVTQTNNVVRGDEVIIECRTTGSRPPAIITWIYKGHIYAVDANAMGDPATVVSLLRRSVAAADNGNVIQCSVTHMTTNTTLIGSTQLNVMFPVDQHTTHIIGNTPFKADGKIPMTLICTTGSSNPASNITWKNGTDVIKNYQNFSNTSGSNNGFIRSQELILIPTRYDNGNIIICSVSNAIIPEPDTTSIVLDLNYSPLINDISDEIVIEGYNAQLPCSASSKPLASFTWYIGTHTLVSGNGTSEYNGFDFQIAPVNRSHTGTYRCTAENSVSPNDSKQTRLTVQYPPDIAVTVVNVSIKNPSTILTCEASGVPAKYTYETWVHTWWNGEILHYEQLGNTRELTLTDLTYAHSGVYTCGASNGIKGSSYGSGSLLVKSFPIIVEDVKELKASGYLMQPITVTFRYYSNAGDGLVKVFRINKTDEVVDEVDNQQRKVTVTLPVFNTKVETTGIEATITINITRESQFGEYGINVTNDVGTTEVILVIQPLAPPGPESGTSIGLIVGGAVGGLVVALCVVALAVFILLRRKGNSYPGKRTDTEIAKRRDKTSVHHHTAPIGGQTECVWSDVSVPSQSIQQYESLNDTTKRVYDVLRSNTTSDHPHTYDNYGHSTYESLHRSTSSDTRTYEELQQHAAQPIVYENLKLTSPV